MNKKNDYQNLFIGFGLICAVCLILTGLCLGLPVNTGNKGNSGSQKAEKSFEEQVSDKKKELQDARGSYCPDTIVLNNTTKERAESLAKRLGAQVRLTKREDYAVLYLPEGTSIEDVYADEEYKADILTMTPDYTVRTMAVDALGHELMASRPQYTVNDTFYQSQGYLDYLNMQDTWNISKGSGVKIAVIDTGIDTDNPEFAGRISDLSYNASEDKVVQDYGISMIEDTDGHGTQVAGVLAAGMDGNGITGIAPQAELIVIKCETDGRGKYLRGSDLVFGLAYAIECDADVVNMSFGTSINVFSTYTRLAVDSDVICVAAAGNDGSGMPVYPAADPKVIGVGALGADGWDLDSYSNFGDNSDIVAPGTVYTTAINNEYGYSAGTSLASPLAAGAIALYISNHPHTEFNQICRLLEASSTDLGSPGEDWFYGYGALDVCAFLCGEQGTITYDMQTDDLSNETQTFVKGHSVQTMPEPERDNVVFDGWFFDPECTDECDYYTHIFTEDTTLYANWINEDEGTAYVYVIKPDDTVEIRSYTGKRRYLTIPETLEGRTVSSIGDSAFENNARVRTIELPSTIKTIGNRAFMYCSNLRSIDIPEDVESIGSNAFAGCVRMTSVGIAARGRLTSIGGGAFSMCSISSFLIPEKLTDLGGGVFLQSTSMRSVTVAQGNKTFQIKNDALYDAAGETLIYYPAGLITDYQVSSGTKKIGYAAFAYSQIMQISLPSGLTEIGDSAFFAASGLHTVSIPASVTAMGGSTFAHCYGLMEAVFDSGSHIKEIPGGAFKYCGRLKEISVPDNVEVIGGSAFDCSGLQRISFSNKSKLTSIEGSAFAYTPIKTIDIPDTVKSIGVCCFKESGLESINFSEHSQCLSIGETSFYKCLRLSGIEFPDSLTILGPRALYQSGIKKVHIGNNLTQIEEGAFSYCQSLEEISVGSGNAAYSSYDGLLYDHAKENIMLCPAGRKGRVTLTGSTRKIQSYAFAGTDKVSDVVLNSGLQEIGSYAFLESGMQTPALPSSLTTIGEAAFSQCVKMTEPLMIPKAVTSIGRLFVYGDAGLKKIEIEADSSLSRIGYGTFAGCGIETFTVPENVSSMGQEVFAECDNLITVTFEGDNRLRYLAAWTFWGADNLRRITFEEGSNLQLIEARACENMPSLDRIDLSGCKNLTTIDNYAFNSCKNLNTILLPESINEIGRYAFWGCSSLSRIDLPEALSWIGRYAFAGTHQMNVYFKASVLPANLETNWDNGIAGYYLGVEDMINSGDWTYALTRDKKASVIAYHGSADQINLTKIDGYEVVSIGGGAFKGNTTLRSITLPETVTGIYNGAFADTSSLTKVTLPASLEIIDAEAFRNSGVSQVTFNGKSGLKAIGKYAFAQTKGLKELSIPAGVQRISEYAFWKSGIESADIAEGSKLTEIERFAFAESSLKKITLPDTVSKVGDSAFREVGSLKEISFGKGEELSLGAHAFYGSGLETVSIPSTVTKIGELCFTDCGFLTAINVDRANEKYTSDGGVLFNKEMTTLITCPAGKTGSYSIKASVSRLAFAAFEGSKLSRITIPDDSNLITIGYRAFFRCENLETIHIPSGVQSIENYSFAYDKALKTVEIGQGSHLGGIYKSAFYGCEKLSSITIPDSVQEIGDYAFYDCTALKQVSLGVNSKLRGVFGHAFEYSGITRFIMPSQMTELGDYAFHGSALQELSFNDVVTDLGMLALADLDNLTTDEVVIPDSVESIGKGLFQGNQSIRKMTLPFVGASQEDDTNGFMYLFNTQNEYNRVDEVTITGGTRISDEAFSGIESIKKVTLPDSIIEIGSHSFGGCHSMVMNGLPSHIRRVGWCAMAGCYNVYISELPDTLERIDENAFEECSSAARLVVPAVTYEIGKGAFSAMSGLEAIEVDRKNRYYSSVDGILYNYKQTTIIAVPAKLSGKVIISSGVTKLEDSAFYGCSEVTEVVIPNSVTEIGNSCFRKCYGLESITLPESVTEIGGGILVDCTGLKELIIKANILELNSMVDGCSSLEHLELPEGMKHFEGARITNLRELILPDSVELVSLVGCDRLSYVHLGASLQNIFVIRECESISCIDISPDNPYYVSKDGIVYSKDMKELVFVPRNKTGYVEVPNEVNVIGSYSFENCKQITGVNVPDNVTKISEGAFKGCSSLMDISLGKNIEEIGWDAFLGVGYLDHDNWSECREGSALYIGSYLVGSEWDGDPVLRVRNGTKLIATNVFQGVDIEYLYLPDSLRYIDSMAFYRCNNLKYVSFGKGIKKLYPEAFRGAGLRSVYLPSSIESINGAFPDCRQLNYVWVDNPDVTYEGICDDSLIKTARIPLYLGLDPFGYQKHADKVIVSNAKDLNETYFTDYMNVDSYYMDEKREFCPIGNDVGNNFSFRDDWHSIMFFADDMLISLDALKNGSVVQTPSLAEVKDAVPQATSLTGWDINGDGKADKMPATLTEDIVAVAVCDVPITSIKMDEYHDVEVGESFALGTKCLPETHTHEENIVYKSSDNSILSVDSNGKVTGVSTGTATVTASLAENGDIKAKCTINVIPVQYGIKLDEAKGSLNVGETMTLSPRYVLPEGYTTETVWSSTDSAVAEVSNGTITAKAPGRVWIDITRGEYAVSYELNVLQPLKELTVSEKTLSLEVGDSKALTVGYVPENTTVNKTVTWYTNRPGVAVVDDTGLVTAKGPGTAEIHAMIEGKDAYCTVTVTAPLKSVILNTSTGTMRLDRTKQLEMIFTPANTDDDMTVTWKSDKPAIASVSNTGLVTALTRGKAKITGTVVTGTGRQLSASYDVTVIGLKDNKTGIIVANSDDTDTDDAIKLSVDYINESDSYTQTAELVQRALDQYTLEDMQIYDIKLVRDGTAVQPTTTMDVEIPVSQNMVSEETVAYRLEENGTLTDMGAVYEDGKYLFDVEHFSIYVLGKKQKAKVRSITISPDKLTICPGKAGILQVNILPDTADPSVSWASSDNNIVTVTAEGRVTGLKEGVAAITATTQDGSSKQATCDITVSHSWDDGEVTTAATCEDKGIRTYTCEACGTTRTEEIPALDHKYGAWTRKNESEHERVCENNPSHVEIEVHAWDDGRITKDPTCTETGVKTYTCETCGATRTEEIPATGHKWGAWEVVLEATESEAGLEKRVCQTDPTHEETREIPDLSHKHSLIIVTAKDATCLEEGNTEYYVCSECGRYFSDADGTIGINVEDTVIGKGDHTPKDPVREKEIPATCEEEGSYEEVIYCSACGTELSRGIRTILPFGHKYGSWTRKDDTEHQRICENDKTHIQTAVHNWDQGTVAIPVSSEKKAEKTYVCKDCGTKKKEEVAITASYVITWIEALNDSSTKAEITAIRKAYEGLSAAQKEKVPSATLQILISAEERINKDDSNNPNQNANQGQPVTTKPVMISGLTINAISKNLAVNKKVPLTLTVLPGDAANKNVTWTVSNPKLATISNTGVLKLKKAAKGKKVTVTATASDGSGKTASITIKGMKGVVKSVSVKGAKTVKAGKKVSLKASVKASKGANKKLIWTSSNTSYATVKNGKVKTTKAGKGKTVKITAMATDGSGKKKTVKLKIK